MTDAYGRNIPGDDETPDLPKAFEDFSLSMPPGPLTVASRAEANAIRTAAGNPVGFHVWRTDTNQEERWNGSGWEYVAGRQHGATVTFARQDVPAGEPHRLVATSLDRYSPGWTINGEAWLVPPQSGMYLMYGAVNVSGAAGSLGRQYAQISIRNGAGILGREGIANENNYSVGAVMWPLTSSTQLQVQVYHATGGARNYTVQMHLYMLGDPNW